MLNYINISKYISTKVHLFSYIDFNVIFPRYLRNCSYIVYFSDYRYYIKNKKFICVYIVYFLLFLIYISARPGFSTRYEDREEGGKAKGKEGAHGLGGDTGCKM